MGDLSFREPMETLLDWFDGYYQNYCQFCVNGPPERTVIKLHRKGGDGSGEGPVSPAIPDVCTKCMGKVVFFTPTHFEV